MIGKKYPTIFEMRKILKNLILCYMLITAPSTILAQTENLKNLKEYQLTFGNQGHTLNYTQCFSPDDEWLVYDTRNEGGLIGSTCCIEKVNVKNKSISRVYQTLNQTAYGPGVGAVAYNPQKDKVIFIHGIRNSNAANPYGFTRRTGVIVNASKPFKPIFGDARDISPPFTPGALRGGTHAHSWSGDGMWISFTYNDFILDQLQKSDLVKDLRTIGVMAPIKKVRVEKDAFGENNNGKYFSVVLATVKEEPQHGSDDIEKAFDEGWIGKDGYINLKGEKQKRAIAFQGDTRDSCGKIVTEVFVVDIPDDITLANPQKPLEGTSITRPNPPSGTVQRRLTFTSERKYPGIQGPRHWLRTSANGKFIYFLMKDNKGIVQIFSVPTIGGEIKEVTHNMFPVQSAFSLSPDGEYVSYAADNSVFITAIKTGKTHRLTERFSDEEKPEGGMVWSYNGKMIAYNRYIVSNDIKWLQVFILK